MRGINKLSVGSWKLAVKKRLFLIILVVLQVNCIKHLTPEEYISLANTRTGPFCIVKEFETFYYELYYRPTEYFYAQSIINKDGMDSAAVYNTYNKGYYFVLRIVSKDSASIEQKLLYEDFRKKKDMSMLLYTFREYATIEQNGEEIECGQAMIDKSWGMHNDFSVLFAFSRKRDKGSVVHIKKSVLHIKDFGLGTGTVEFNLPRFGNRTLEIKS